MKTMPSTSLHDHFDEIVKYCTNTGKPIVFTKDGKDDLILMSKDAYDSQRANYELKSRLLEIELEQKSGAKYYTLEELKEALEKVVSSK